MPEIRAFRGIRYASPTDLADLACPPYDVITPREQVVLHERHPDNAVRVELPFSEHPDDETGRYRRAAAQFDQWLGAGVLVPDDGDCLYVYRQDFAIEDGSPRRVAGVIGAVRLERYGTGSGILPHEKTMPGPIEDRLALIRACPVNISPIYAIYRGGGSLMPYIDALESRPADARFVDDHGTLHRLWVIRAAGEIEMLSGAVGSCPLVIADGHHRYETALAYHLERSGTPGNHGAVMTFCVDADVEDLVVLPYHRLLDAPVPQDVILDRCMDSFSAKALAPGEGLDALARSDADHPVLVVLEDAELLVEISAEEVASHLPERSPAYRNLDVVALHDIVLPAIVADVAHELSFTRDAHEVIDEVRRGRTAGVILRPLSAVEVADVAQAGERMPQKASYFWPKALTGLVFRSLD